jgi:hypothetical protein
MKIKTQTLEMISLSGLIVVAAAVMLYAGYHIGKNDQPTYELVGDDCIEDEEGFQSVNIYQTKSADTTYIVTVEKIVRQ